MAASATATASATAAANKQKLSAIKNEDIELFTLNGVKTMGKIVDMYDGDTCKIVLLVNMQKFNCRLMGLDTPEMKPSLKKEHRDQEILNAHKCRNRLIQLATNSHCTSLDLILKKPDCKSLIDTNTKLIYIHCLEFDKYGRLLVELFQHEHDKISINQQLINEGLAKAYDGGKKDEFTY
jgi:endonuclease YncB( thermonuclease family)